MKTRERLIAVIVMLALVGVVLLGFAVYGDGYTYNTTDESIENEYSEQEQYTTEDTDDDSKSNESMVIPDLFSAMPLDTNHFVRNNAELADALHNAACGDFITLMDDITFEQRIHIYNRSITLVTNGFSLYLHCQQQLPGYVLQINDGALLLDDSNGGGFNVTGSSGVSVSNGTAEVTSASSTAGNAVFAGAGGSIYVRGNVGGRYVARAQDGGTIYIGGNITGVRFAADYAHDPSVYARGAGSTITVDGNGISSGEHISSVQAIDGATVLINGDIITPNRSSFGILARGAGSFVHVNGNVTSWGSHFVVAESTGVVVIEGDVSGVVAPSIMGWDYPAVTARGINSKISIRGNVIINRGERFIAVHARGAKVTVDGDVIIDFWYSSFGIAVVAEFEGIANIGGNVSALGAFIDGVDVRYGGCIRISGTLASRPMWFGRMRHHPTTLLGYFTYTDYPTTPTTTIWIRGNPTTTALTAVAPSLPRTGGNSQITLTGSDLGAADLRIAAFLNNTGSALYSQTPVITNTQATAILNFPANTTDAVRNYTIRVSIDGGDTWLTTPTTTVTIASATTVPSSDTTLSSLSTTPGILSPAFDPNVLEYTVSVGSHVTAVSVSALTNCPYATAIITGYNLTYGQNTLTVLVTAQDGTTSTYTFTITVTRATAIVRFHMHIPGMAPYIEIGLPEINTTIPSHLRPTIPLRNGTVGNPGWAFLGWYEELFPYMHSPRNTNRTPVNHAGREAAIDLLANLVITEAMLDANGVYELHASWLQYGDLNGDGTVDLLDRSLLQNRILGGITDDDMIMQTANLYQREMYLSSVERVLLQNFVLGAPDIILPVR